MTVAAIELKRAWPDYPTTHDISYAGWSGSRRATDAADTERIWDNEEWWRDPE